MKGVELFRTDAFTRYGAIFNKGMAIEEAFDVIGRSGWILIVDADIALPATFELGELDRDVLYGAARRQLPEGVLDLDGDWERWELTREDPCAGYFQLFHAEAAALRSLPWYPRGYMNAAYADWDFALRFTTRTALPSPVLHIGRQYENWCGRASPRLDGTAVPDADRKLVQMGELLMAGGWGTRPDLEALALAARRAIKRE
jgi:hypothetical protein